MMTTIYLGEGRCGLAQAQNQAWCEWLMSLAIGTRRAVLKRELLYFDTWIAGAMTRDLIIEDAVR